MDSPKFIPKTLLEIFTIYQDFRNELMIMNSKHSCVFIWTRNTSGWKKFNFLQKYCTENYSYLFTRKPVDIFMEGRKNIGKAIRTNRKNLSFMQCVICCAECRLLNLEKL